MEGLACGPVCVIPRYRNGLSCVTRQTEVQPPLLTSPSQVYITTFPGRAGHKDGRTNHVLRADQLHATLFPGVSPKREGCVKQLLAVLTRMYRWANKNHMTSFMESCWQAWEIPKGHLTCVCCQGITHHGNQASFHHTCWPLAQLKRVKKVRLLNINSITLSKPLLWPFSEKEM